MAKKSLVTTETTKSVSKLIDEIENESKKQDSKELLKIFKDITQLKPKVWGDNFIIGFGKYTYTRKGSKDEYEWFNMGFAPRKSNITIYLTYDISQHADLLKKLGKHKVGKGCLYINKLADVDIDVLKELITRSKNSSWHPEQ